MKKKVKKKMILIKIFVQNISRFNQVSLFGNLDSSICHSILCYSLLIYASLICMYPPCLISNLSYGISSLSIYYVPLPDNFHSQMISYYLSLAFSLTLPLPLSLSLHWLLSTLLLSLYLSILPLPSLSLH